MAFNIDTYEMVKDRLPVFYEKFSNGRVITEIYSESENHVTIKASLFKDADDQMNFSPLATGYAREERGGHIDKYTENCETSAIGRALANLNLYGELGSETGNRPSREEMAAVQQQEPKPIPSPKKVTQQVQRPINTNGKTINGDQNSSGLEPIAFPATWNCIWGYCDASETGETEPRLVQRQNGTIRGGTAIKEKWETDIVACAKQIKGIRPDGLDWCNYQCKKDEFVTNTENEIKDWDNGSQY